MIKRHNDLLSPLISPHQGNLIEIIGDALLASFEEPSKAVACAVRMQEVLAQDNQGRPEQDQVQIRIGLNLDPGFVEAGHVYGVVVHIAERIRSLAEGRQILISESVYRALQTGRDPLCVFLDKVQVKGKEGDIKVYRVVWRAEEEMQRPVLREAQVQGDLVLEVSREAGKQRVAQEIKQRIAVMQRGVGGITKGQAVTYTLSDGKKIQKVTEVVTGTGSVVRAVSFHHK